MSSSKYWVAVLSLCLTACTSPDVAEIDEGTEVSYQDYLTFAESYCENTNGKGSDRLLLSQFAWSGEPPAFRFLGDHGGGFIYITESCELFTPQKCTQEGTDQCSRFYGSLPYSRTELSSDQLAKILSEMRALEWSEKLEDEATYAHFSQEYVATNFGNQHFWISTEYMDSSPNQEDQEIDELLRDVLSPRTYSGFAGAMGEALEGAQEYQPDHVRVVLSEVDPSASAHWLEDQVVFDWPLSLPSDDYQFLGLGEEYCTNSIVVSGSDADVLRGLIQQLIAQDSPAARPHIMVAEGDRRFGIEVRETLPFENELGLIDNGLWEARICE